MSVLCSINNERAWERLEGYGSNDVVIGFADDGCCLPSVDRNFHNKFIAVAYIDNGKLITGSPDNMQDRMYIAAHRHGTALAGLMAAPLSSILPVGVAPGCRLLPVRWEMHSVLNKPQYSGLSR